MATTPTNMTSTLRLQSTWTRMLRALGALDAGGDAEVTPAALRAALSLSSDEAALCVMEEYARAARQADEADEDAVGAKTDAERTAVAQAAAQALAQAKALAQRSRTRGDSLYAAASAAGNLRRRPSQAHSRASSALRSAE